MLFERDILTFPHELLLQAADKITSEPESALAQVWVQINTERVIPEITNFLEIVKELSTETEGVPSAEKEKALSKDTPEQAEKDRESRIANSLANLSTEAKYLLLIIGNSATMKNP